MLFALLINYNDSSFAIFALWKHITWQIIIEAVITLHMLETVSHQNIYFIQSRKGTKRSRSSCRGRGGEEDIRGIKDRDIKRQWLSKSFPSDSSRDPTNTTNVSSFWDCTGTRNITRSVGFLRVRRLLH